MAEFTTGQLLVATPTMDDSDFARTVVYMVEHSADGAIGVILNRPSPIPVADAIPSLAAACAPPEQLFSGGPVMPEGVMCLAAAPAGSDVEGFFPGPAGFGRLDLDGRVDGSLNGIDTIRLFAGHAGWIAGQLEAELLMHSWYVCPAVSDDAFVAEPDQLWNEVLYRQGGRLRALAFVPPDRSLN